MSFHAEKSLMYAKTNFETSEFETPFLSYCWIGSYLVLMATYGIPKLVYDQIMIGGLPIYHYFLGIFLVVSASLSTRHLYRSARWLFLWVCIFAWLIVATFINRQILPFNIGAAVLDGASLILIVASSFLVICIEPKLRTAMLQLLIWMQIVELAIVDFLILSGIIAPENQGDRLSDYSMWALCMGIAVVLPVVFAEYIKRRHYVFCSLLFIAATGVTLVAGLLSQTRSVSIGSIISAAACAWCLFRSGHIKATGWLLIPSVGLGVLMIWLFQRTDFGFYFRERVLSNDSLDDPRMAEMHMLFSQLPSNLVFGFGLGTFFVSPIGSGEMGDGLATVPHIGILTPLVKGGVLFGIVGTIWPLFLALRETIIRGSDVAASYANGIIIYYFISCLSGGWHYSETAILGLLLGGFLVAREPSEICPEESGNKHMGKRAVPERAVGNSHGQNASGQALAEPAAKPSTEGGPRRRSFATRFRRFGR